MDYKVLRSEILFRGKVFDLEVDEIQYPSGNTAVREVAVHPGGAVVVPYKGDGKVVLVRQFRYPFKKYLIELPAGKLDKNEEPYICAGRELTEETGYTAKEIIRLGEIRTTPGFCTEVLHIFLATDLKEGKHNREEGEQGMEIIEVPFNEAEQMIMRGDITDSKTICGIYLAGRYLSLP
jgi:ADP-ribose pyrophosphatase